jgi:hypothetical protein
LTKNSLMAMTNSVGAGRSAPKELNTSLKAGITKIMITPRDHEGHDDDRNGVHQRRLDLGLDGLGLFHVGGQPVQQASRIPAASPASTRLQYRLSKYSGYLRNAADSEVPVSTSARMSLSSLVTLGLGLPRPRCRTLQQRHAGLHHGGQLAREDGDVLGLDRLPERMRRFLILVGEHALAAQRGLHLVLAGGAGFAAHDLPLRSLPSHS